MLKIGMIGIGAAFLSLILKKDKPDMALALGIATGVSIFGMAIMQLGVVIDFLKQLVAQLPIDAQFFARMLKMLGIAYIAEFSASICKDSGYSAVAAEIELFAKVAIVALSIPVLTYLVQIMGDMI